eukprot:scaffold739_cov329-Amphora_coffeaeformis.AAC.1
MMLIVVIMHNNMSDEWRDTSDSQRRHAYLVALRFAGLVLPIATFQFWCKDFRADNNSVGRQ